MANPRTRSNNYWHTHVSPFFEPLLASLVINTPPNPRAWIIETLSGKDSPPASDKDGEQEGAGGAPPKPPSPDGKVHPGNEGEIENKPPPTSGGVNVLYSQEAFKVDPVTGEKIEADTADAEDAVELSKILLPGSDFPEDVSNFSVSYNKALLDAWVKQPSPCCGAASVAGAANCIRGIKRGEEGCIGHLDVLPLMSKLLEDQLATKKRQLERLVGCVDPLIEKIKSELAKEGRTLGGKEKNGAKQGAPKSLLLKLIKKVVVEEMARREEEEKGMGEDSEEVPSNIAPADVGEDQDQGQDNVQEEQAREEEELSSFQQQNSGDCFARINALYIEASKKSAAAKEKEDNPGEDEEDVDEDDRDDDDDQAPDVANAENKSTPAPSSSENLLVFDFTKPVKKSARKSSSTPSWKSLLLEVLKKLGGIEKVNHPLKPSTGPFGNWGIIGAFKSLSSLSTDYAFTCTSLMGKNPSKPSPTYIPLKPSDPPPLIESQWRRLSLLFNTTDTVLLSHHKNHYALIYALREYRNKNTGDSVRQCFTARKGQRPSEWIDFEELRDTYLGWEGYKLMVVKGKKI
mmetsp:Transcript_171/g.289  ORF Transcript_171/g.289 Transcript_171/m.289 type:complete len:573 (-) Transcript_171:9-1727(-)